MNGYDNMFAFFINEIFNRHIGANILCLLLALAGALVIYFRFLAPKGESPYEYFGDWLHDFLDFKAMLLEPLIKVLYLFGVIYIIAISVYLFFAMIYTSGFSWMPLVGIVAGNVALRITYEFLMLIVRFFGNIADISRK